MIPQTFPVTTALRPRWARQQARWQTTMWVVTYHYIHSGGPTRPGMKGQSVEEFRRQITHLSRRFEMATLDSALAFLDGEYSPVHDLCLITFDDGLKEHYDLVLPVLNERNIQGVFCLPTACVEHRLITPVHKHHLLMNSMEFSEYREALSDHLETLAPEFVRSPHPEATASGRRWDDPEVASLQALLNFALPDRLQTQLLEVLFEECLGDQRPYAEQLYLTWEEAREIQDSGMVVGGHSHAHWALESLSPQHQEADVRMNLELLKRHLGPQAQWPFSYPNGRPAEACTPETAELLARVGFCCAFSSDSGSNGTCQDRFAIRRIDAQDVKT